MRDAIFLGSCNYCCSREKTSRTERLNSAGEPTQQELENGEEREALLPRRRLIIDVHAVPTLLPTGSACQFSVLKTERSACEDLNQRGLCDSTK